MGKTLLVCAASNIAGMVHNLLDRLYGSHGNRCCMFDDGSLSFFAFFSRHHIRPVMSAAMGQSRLIHAVSQ